MNNTLAEIKDRILEAKNIYLASHVQPDGDNLGSLLGLFGALKKINDNVFILKSDDIPKDYLFLSGIENVVDHNPEDLDLFIALDCAEEHRLGRNKKLMDGANFIINIDHHLSNTNYGNINMVDSDAAATAELVYILIDYLEIPIDEDMATNIYTGISTDTGSFIYESTSSRTHRIAADLIDKGARTNEVSINLYQSNSLEKTKMFIEVIKDMELLFDNKVSLAIVTQDKLKKTNTKMDDTEGIVSFIRDIETVEVAILFKEMSENEVKLSMRSKKYVNVSDLCGAFGGGGHKRAAGCTINEPIGVVKQLVIDKLKEMF